MPDESASTQTATPPTEVTPSNSSPSVPPGAFPAQSRLERSISGKEPDFPDPDSLSEARQADLDSREDRGESSEGKTPQPSQGTDSDSTRIPPAAKTKPSLAQVPNVKKTSKDWDSLKQRHAREVAELKQQLDALRSNSDAETMRKELDEARNILRQVAIERDPAFVKEFETSHKTALQAAKLAAGAKGSGLEKLLEAPQSAFRDEQIDELISTLPPSAQRRINAALGTLDQIEIQRVAKIEQAKATWDQRQLEAIQQHTQQTTERQRQLASTFDRTLKEWQQPGDEGHFLYQGSDDAGSKAAIKESVSLARQMIEGKLSDDDLVRAALHVGSIPRLFQFIEQVVSERDTLKNQIEKIQASQPGDGLGAPSGGDGKTRTIDDPGYDDEFTAQLRAARKQDFSGGV